MKKYYAVVTNEKDNGDHQIKRFSKREAAEQYAKINKGKLFEYEGKPLDLGDDHKRGRLIKDYSR